MSFNAAAAARSTISIIQPVRLRGALETWWVVVASEVLYLVSRVLVRLTRVEAHGREEVIRSKTEGRKIIFVSWHGFNLYNVNVWFRLFTAPLLPVIMVTENREGRIMGRFGRRLGFEVVPMGQEESPQQRARAVVKMIAAVKAGHDALIAVDGPGGPPGQVKPGAALIALRSGAVLVPTFVAARRPIRLRHRWDRHLLWLPFDRTVVVFGPLIDTNPVAGPTPTVDEIQVGIACALRDGAQLAEALAKRRSSRA